LTTADIRNRIGEVRVVENVIGIRTQTEAHMLRDPKIL
jgi:hypothetical protein